MKKIFVNKLNLDIDKNNHWLSKHFGLHCYNKAKQELNAGMEIKTIFGYALPQILWMTKYFEEHKIEIPNEEDVKKINQGGENGN